MTLTTHGVAGAAVAALVPTHPILGFVFGFASHFALDSIPHWAEGPALLRSVVKDPHNKLNTRVRPGMDMVHDILVVLTDSAIGFALSLLILSYFFHVPVFIVLLGAFAGQMPDGLQFVYWNTRLKIMDGLQRFHGRIQEEHEDMTYLGIEVGIILAVVALGVLGVFMLQ